MNASPAYSFYPICSAGNGDHDAAGGLVAEEDEEESPNKKKAPVWKSKGKGKQKPKKKPQQQQRIIRRKLPNPETLAGKNGG